MSKTLKEYYDASGFQNVAVLKIDWGEERENEYTVEEISCTAGGKFYHMTVKMEYGAERLAGIKKFTVLNKKEISEYKFRGNKDLDLTRK